MGVTSFVDLSHWSATSTHGSGESSFVALGMEEQHCMTGMSRSECQACGNCRDVRIGKERSRSNFFGDLQA